MASNWARDFYEEFQALRIPQDNGPKIFFESQLQQDAFRRLLDSYQDRLQNFLNPLKAEAKNSASKVIHVPTPWHAWAALFDWQLMALDLSPHMVWRNCRKFQSPCFADKPSILTRSRPLFIGRRASLQEKLGA